MNVFYRRKTVTAFIATIIALVCTVSSVYVTYLICRNSIPTSYVLVDNGKNKPENRENNKKHLSAEELYKASVADAVFADSDEIFPLVTVDGDMMTWNETNDRILLLSWHSYPDRYHEGESVTFSWGEVWTFTDKEIAEWYDDNYKGVTDWELRLEQLIGLPPESGYTHISAFWVSPDDVIRPAYETDIGKQMTNSFSEIESEPTEFVEWYSEWFKNNVMWSYFDSAYPWTRLGYTYDWADNGKEYGLSEFIVLPDSEAEVEFTKSTDDFVSWLAEQ